MIKVNLSVENVGRLYATLYAITQNKGFSDHWIKRLDLLTPDAKQDIRDHHISIRPQLIKMQEVLSELKEKHQIRTYCIELSRYIDKYIRTPVFEIDGLSRYETLTDFLNDQTIPIKGLSVAETLRRLDKSIHPFSRWTRSTIRTFYYGPEYKK